MAKIRSILLLLHATLVMLLVAPGAMAQNEANQLDRSGWVLSSSINNGGLNSAIDGNDSTRWTTLRQAQQPGQYFQIDLGSVQSFEHIVLDSSNSPNDQPNRYEVYVSNTNNNFGAAIASGSGSDNGITQITFASVDARYVRIVQTGSTTRNWWSIHEVNIYDNRADSNGWILSASINNADLNNAIDNNPDTRWTTQGQVQRPGQYFQIDLGEAQSFNQLLLDSSGSPNDQPNGYEVYVSNNDNNFGTAIASGSGSDNGQTLITFASVSARYIRIVQTGSTESNWWSIHEVSLHSTSEPSSLPESFSHVVTFNSESVTLNFKKFSSRGPLFSIFTQEPDGRLIEMSDVDENRAYIGLVEGHPEAFAAGSIRADGSILATVVFPDEMTWRDQDGVVSALSSDFTPVMAPTAFLAEKAGSNVYAADVFVDLPYSYIRETDGSTNKALEALDYNFALINATFMRDASIVNRIGKVIMRTNESQDPYTSFTGRDVLFPFFRNQNLTQNEVVNGAHDIGALITPQVAGIASLSAVRNSVAFMIAGTRNNGNGYFIADGRHEFGHVWGSNHDEGGVKIEGPTILETGNNNPFGKFAAPSIAKILPVRDDSFSRGHLEALGNIAPQLPPRAADDMVNITLGSSQVVLPLQNDNDVNNDDIALVSVQNVTNAGNPISVNGNSITIAANVNPSGGYDWFRYTIEDTSGLISTAVVHIRVASSAQDSDTFGHLLQLDSASHAEALSEDGTVCDHH